MDYGITYNGEPPIMEGYFDASYITNEEDNSSTSGWCLFIGEVYSSKKQTAKVHSTMSVEFIVLASAAMKRSG